MNIKEIEDRLLLRELIDKISILGDKKDFNAQVQLFSQNAVSETVAGGKVILKLKGRKEMAKMLAEFLKEVETVYHFNGQQIVNINDDYANGTCYCTVTLIGNENGKQVKTTIGAIYHDHYVRINNQWLIDKRIGIFDWQEKVNINNRVMPKNDHHLLSDLQIQRKENNFL